ncbi:hypothetical protein ACFQ2B_40865 [Streptomyces stramineus]
MALGSGSAVPPGPLALIPILRGPGLHVSVLNVQAIRGQTITEPGVSLVCQAAISDPSERSDLVPGEILLSPSQEHEFIELHAASSTGQQPKRGPEVLGVNVRTLTVDRLSHG